jgi:hypothetical protein
MSMELELFHSRGWECPKCNNVLAPWIPSCWHCAKDVRENLNVRDYVQKNPGFWWCPQCNEMMSANMEAYTEHCKICKG